MAPDDDCYSKMQGNMRPRNPRLIDTTLPPTTRYAYRKGEQMSMDPVGPVVVATPRGLDSMMVYGDKSTSYLSVQLYKSEAAGGRRKTKRSAGRGAEFPRARRRQRIAADQRISGEWRSHGGAEARRKQREESTTGHKGNWRVP
jgi:hypothetical protein